MNINLTIGKLADLIESYKQIELESHKEVAISDLGISVPTPSGLAPIQFFIKKDALPIQRATLSNGYSFSAAKKHILRLPNGIDSYLDSLNPGDSISHKSGEVTILSKVDLPEEDCFDIGIPAPHLYYDANGVIHHNTIITAVLSHKCEPYGRTVVVVPSTDLVKQTEEDFINMGLDVGVFFGSRKEYTRTHTICTWQSLNSMFKKTKDGSANVPFSDFIDGVCCVIIDECLAPGTMIQTPDGVKPIETFLPGDKIISFDENAQEFVEDEVVKLHTNLPKSDGAEMYEFELEDGNKIQITGNHKMLTDRGWIEARDINEGDNIRSY